MTKADASGVDPFAIGRQFWDTWSGFAQGALNGQTPAWGDPLAVFAKAAQAPADDVQHMVESMAEQGQQFFAFLQGAASKLGIGETLDAAQVAELWRKTVADGNPVLDALRAASGQGARGFEQLQAGIAPFLATLRGTLERQFSVPAFGYTRERQEHWQALLRAQAEYAETQAAHQALLAKAGQRGIEYFENKLAERSEPGRQIDSARALYDLWVDAAEEAYAEVAMSPEFRTAYGAMVNAQMRLRQLVQKEVEQQAASLGMPTRSELDSTHRTIRTLRDELRELRRELDTLRGKPAPDDVAVPATPAKAKPARASRATAATAVAGKPADHRKPAAATAVRAGRKTTKGR